MDVILAARQLGKAIQEDERFIRYAKARLQNDNDADLQNEIGKFNIKRMELEKAVSDENKDDELVKKLNEELREIYGNVMANPVMVEYNTAKSFVDQMVNDFNVIISKCLDGEDPETCEIGDACTGSCATCGGCH